MQDTRYFVLETGPDADVYGLLRYHEDDHTLMLSRFDKESKSWVDDPTLFDHFREGSTDPRRITPEKAAQLAKSFGGSI